jgi:hypothetical protein
MRNDARLDHPPAVAPGRLLLQAPDIAMRNAKVTTGSTKNVPASPIDIHFMQRLVIDPSSVTTTAEEGDGGSISITGPGLLWLDHSQITTSVEGLAGNGGDIRIAAGILLLETGFIQANTNAKRARGGNVAVNVGALLSSGAVLVGGDTALTFDPTLAGMNVIQAAAPGGISGNVQLATPALDIAGDLGTLSTTITEPAPLTRDLCLRGAGSSLTPLGRGGLRPSALGLMRPEAGTITRATNTDRPSRSTASNILPSALPLAAAY